LSTNSEAKYSIREAYRYFSGLNEYSTFPYKEFLIQDEFINKIVNYYGTKGEYIKLKEWNLIRLYFKWMGVRSEQEKIGYTYVSKPRSIFEATKFHSFRDSAMAEIFAEYFKSVEDPYKSVVLVSAYHSLQNPEDISGINDCCIPKSVKTFGQILKEKYLIHFYNIGFIADDKIKVNQLKEFAKNERKIVGNPIMSMPSLSGFVVLDNIVESEYYVNFLFNKSFLSNWMKNFAILFFLIGE
jgi:hypothetical protein